MANFLMRYISFLGFLVLGLFSFNADTVNSKYDGILDLKVDTSRSYILIINAFDLNHQKMRKNKKELFTQLLTELKSYIQIQLNKASDGKTEIIEEVVYPGADSILKILKERNATSAIIIKDYNVFFNQNGVEVTKSPEGKNRVARYDICSEITYLYYNTAQLVDSIPVQVCEFYSNRSVASGLLAAGPNIVSNKKEAINITKRNVERYFYTFHGD